ncbi:hypothetical protein HFE03_07855 [Paenibacillus sp. EKM102P]|uniref:hypothetical protein n=1 Tax=unclassified Paenibacillus TaxID=185978 RepID=UPI00142E6E02|nr:MULTISPECIES: hypothetical protein [unclassified Paenibacillus]KAF6620558.1 hypothetical protein HFE00_05760 [Paenibacillus sp. EKM101P]KAF6623550.1 hypothetical protein HFE03_07855 [Paenibacillus sp. EKM102P]KAF6633887.1 hypothetical protein HFE01_06655 [Paenibacillus sp. EKM10P]KAF6649414.1 hypothetical protein HFE02_01615 [Paenibacillus sp. EKM11P]
MTAGYTLSLEEVRKIIVKHLNETGVYIPMDDSFIMVLDEHDQLIDNTNVLQVYHEIE